MGQADLLRLHSREYHGNTKAGMRKAFKAPGRRGAGRPEGIDIAKDGRDLPVEAARQKSSTDSIADKMSDMFSNHPWPVEEGMPVRCIK
ncbi:MAG: hypothetical protein Q4C27_02405 [Eubacteriales bacterium]|nr:hypothetical protein [Eubacteriales bacterium]